MDFKNKYAILISVFIVFLVSLIVWVGVDVNNKIKKGENTISVSATGEVYAKPDVALTSFSVVTEAKTVSEAVAENTEKMNAVIDLIKEQGIEAQDLKTIAFNIYPRYDWQEKGGKRVLRGYEAYQTLRVKIRNMEKIGVILQGATNQGANQVGDLQFTIDEPDKLQEQARAQAIEKARAKAKELAWQLGVRLGKVVQFSEGGVFPAFYMAEEMKAGIGGGGEPQIETGENKISVTVTITYEIN